MYVVYEPACCILSVENTQGYLAFGGGKEKKKKRKKIKKTE